MPHHPLISVSPDTSVIKWAISLHQGYFQAFPLSGCLSASFFAPWQTCMFPAWVLALCLMVGGKRFGGSVILTGSHRQCLFPNYLHIWSSFCTWHILACVRTPESKLKKWKPLQQDVMLTHSFLLPYGLQSCCWKLCRLSGSFLSKIKLGEKIKKCHSRKTHNTRRT